MRQILTIIISALTLSGCYKSEFLNTSHPTQAQIGFVVDDKGSDPSSGGMSLADIGGEFTIVFDKEEHTLTESEPLTIPYLLDPGDYTYYIYTKKEIVRSESSAYFTYVESPESITASVASDFGEVLTADHDLYFGKATVSVDKDQNYTISPTIYPETRELNIKLQLEGGSDDQLAAVTGTLTGVATEWNCISDTSSGSTATLQLVFDILKEGDDYYIHSISTVLGFSGTKQELTLTLVYSSDNPASHTITSDLTSDLATFNNNKSIPFYLTTTYEIPDDTSTGGVITGWTPETDVDVDVK